MYVVTTECSLLETLKIKLVCKDFPLSAISASANVMLLEEASFSFFFLETASRGGAEKERERESQAGFTLTVEPYAGLDPMTLRS